uniref:Xylulose kinase-1 n=1 Tax=Tanacetum cinerariifolium TaxID=118510 RepID=A0A699HL00_TANCI|nr:hypothetical protein [Tanacetum cinerariifolium]
MAPLTFANAHNMIVFLTKSDASEGFDQIVNFLNAHTIQYALMVNPPIYVSCIKQFWASISVKKTNDVVKLQPLIDRKKVVITKDTIRQDLRLDDADGVEYLPNEEIFAELARVETPLFDTMLVQPQADTENEDDNEERMEEDVTTIKEVNAAEPTVFDDEEFDRDEEPTKKRASKETLLQESFKKLRAEVEVSCSHSTQQDTLTVDSIEMSEEYVQNMLQIVLVAEFKVEALQVNTAVPTVDKEKALWVELKRLFETNADDAIWKLQRYMHYLSIWKLHSNCEVHQVSSTTRRYDMYMLAEKDYLLSDGVMILILSTKLQVEEDNEMARDLVMKIFMKANQPKSKSLDTSSK